jgi:cardiolipin synthase
MLYGWYESALTVLLGAGLTDALDGTIARAANQRTKLGMYLDPLADKLLLTSGFLTLSALHLVPLWMVILVVSRDVILLAGALLAHLTDSAVDIAPTLLGKGTTVFQLTYLLLAVGCVAWQADMRLLDPLLYLVVLLTVASGFHYLYRGFTHLNVGSVQP